VVGAGLATGRDAVSRRAVGLEKRVCAGELGVEVRVCVGELGAGMRVCAGGFRAPTLPPEVPRLERSVP
jgi:hypothetical protein